MQNNIYCVFLPTYILFSIPALFTPWVLFCNDRSLNPNCAVFADILNLIFSYCYGAALSSVLVLLSRVWFYSLMGLNLYLIWSLLTLFNYFITAESFFVDLPNRVLQNDALINLFSFFWTSPTYLSLVLYLIVLILLLRYDFMGVNVSVLVLAFIYFVGSTECFDLLTINSTMSTLISSSEINALLSNSLNKYHPLILYWSSFLCFVNIFALLSIYTPLLKFQLNLTLINYQSLMLQVFGLNFTALALGSWWALQEGTWGGWWNWDASEVLGLLILLTVLWFTHSSSNVTNLAKIADVMFLTLSAVILSYYTLQLNFELTSHSFGSRFTYFFNNNLFLLEVASIVLFYVIFQVSQKFSLRTTFLAKRGSNPDGRSWDRNFTPYVVWIFLAIFLLIILASFLPLLNYFVWRYLKVNSFNSYVLVEFWVCSLTVGLILLTYLDNSLVFFSFILLVLGNLDFLLLLILWGSCTYNKLSILHSLTYLFLVINLWSYQFQVVIWCDTSPMSYLVGGQTNLLVGYTNYSCSNHMVDSGVYSYNTAYNLVAYSNFFYNSNANQLNNFWLYLDNLTMGSLFYNNLSWHSSASYIELLVLNNLGEVLFVWFLLLVVLIYRPLFSDVSKF